MHESVGHLTRKQWEEFHFDPADADRSHAIMCLKRPAATATFLGERSREWLREGARRWEKEQPEWYTPEWVQALTPELAFMLIVDDERELRSLEAESNFQQACEANGLFVRQSSDKDSTKTRHKGGPVIV